MNLNVKIIYYIFDEVLLNDDILWSTDDVVL